jgi:uncharacterized surface protein with fasciclin (FAS1) repeats
VAEKKRDLLSAAAEAGGFTTFLSLAEQAGLPELLKAGRHTIFAPTDEAFAKFPAEATEKLGLPEQRALLRAVVTGHLVAGQVLTRQLAGKRIRGKSVGGGELVIAGAKKFTVNGATIVRPDIMAANGVLHGVDKVLWPTRREAGAPPVG